MRVAIIEDNEQTRTANAALFSAASTPALPMQVRAYASTEAYQFDQQPVDLLVLDIRLGDNVDGMTFARNLRKQDSQLPIVFLSNYDDYVFDGYDVNALGYIMKPLTPAKVTRILAKTAAHRPAPGIVLHTDAGVERLELFDIQAVEVVDHDLIYHTQHGQKQAAGQLAELVTNLPANFVQVHRAVVVNLDFVARLTGKSVILLDGSELPVARARQKQLKTEFLARMRRLADDD